MAGPTQDRSLFYRHLYHHHTGNLDILLFAKRLEDLVSPRYFIYNLKAVRVYPWIALGLINSLLFVVLVAGTHTLVEECNREELPRPSVLASTPPSRCCGKKNGVLVPPQRVTIPALGSTTSSLAFRLQ